MFLFSSSALLSRKEPHYFATSVITAVHVSIFSHSSTKGMQIRFRFANMRIKIILIQLKRHPLEELPLNKSVSRTYPTVLEVESMYTCEWDVVRLTSSVPV